MTNLKNYRGNKNIPGIYQWIINRIPPHSLMIEPFAGSAAISFRINSPAPTVLNDCNTGVTDALTCMIRKNMTISNLPAVQLLSSFAQAGTDTFIYCDPPYMLSTRGSTRQIYEYEMEDSDHYIFLSVVRTAKYNCMISHYECDLYNNLLSNWQREHFKVRYHNKTVKETIYYNYAKPDLLQSYQYVGSDCWDRQRITRKINRLASKLAALPALERNAIISRSQSLQSKQSVLDHVGFP